MLHSPSSFEVSKPSLAGRSRCVQEHSSTPGRLNLHSHFMISCCYRSAPLRQRLTLLLTCSIRSRATVQCLIGHVLLQRQFLATRFLHGHQDLHLREGRVPVSCG